MKTFLIILISFDFILLFIGKIIFYKRVYKVVSWKDFIDRIDKALPDFVKEEKDRIPWKDKTILKRVITVILFPFKLVFGLGGALFFIGVGVAIGLGIPTASIWGTIWIGMSISMTWAVIFLLALNGVYLLLGLWMYSASNIDKKVLKRVLINDVIKFSMLLLTLYFVGFSFDLSIQNLTAIPYEWNITLNNIASIFLPMVFMQF